MRLIALFFCILSLTAAIAQDIKIIPQPVEMRLLNSPATFTITSKTKIIIPDVEGLGTTIAFFTDYVNRFYNLNLAVQKQSGIRPSSNTIIINAQKTGSSNNKEQYSLLVNKTSITISSETNNGIFYGLQTLIQLLPVPTQSFVRQAIKLSIPQLAITDYPRFAYRGLHLDVGRHFMPVDFIKKYIDYIALHKMNYFHWHLTEDQGWRIEIKKYPRLTEVGAWRNGTLIGRYPGAGNDNTRYGGFYTQAQIKDIVKYASDRYITVVPEIEMPGHSSAAIASYPYLSCFPDEPTKIPGNMISEKSKMASNTKLVQETWGVFNDVFCAGKEETFKFLEDVLDEVIQLFPGKYFHVGGDECPKENWKRCNNCQQRIKALNLHDEHELQSYFIQRMEKYLNAKGKTLIGWDEILEGGLAPKAIVMSWRGEEGGIAAAKQKHEVIMTPGNPVYFDHTQSQNEDSVTIGGYNPIEKVYAYEPIPRELSADDAKYVLGAQANVWTEYMKNPSKVEYMIFPRVAALSEVLWSPKEKKDWRDFEKRLTLQFTRYDFWKANYSKAYYDIKSSIEPSPDNIGVTWKLETKQAGAQIKYVMHTAGIISSPRFSEGKIYTTPLTVTNSMILAAVSVINNKTVSNPVYQTFIFNKATGKKITLKQEPDKKYPGDGVFTLVNGAQNEKGMARSLEFLGFSGTNCEAIIDLGSLQKVKNVVVHTLDQKGSWIWRPLMVEVSVSENGIDYTSVGLTNDFIIKKQGIGIGTMKVEFAERDAKFVRVVVKNWGDIPQGNAGAGNKPWLFVDEIEVN